MSLRVIVRFRGDPVSEYTGTPPSVGEEVYVKHFGSNSMSGPYRVVNREWKFIDGRNSAEVFVSIEDGS